MKEVLEIILYVLFFLILYSYILYPVVLYAFSYFFKKKVSFDKQHKPTFGIVIPVYNEEKVIIEKIKNILAINYPPNKLSIWIGSDQSSDNTNKLVEEFDDLRVHLWIAPKRGGKTEILNNFIPMIDAQILLMTDANTMHDPECLNKMAGYFADESVGAVAGRVIHTQSGGSELSEVAYRSFEVWQKKNESMLHSSISAFGGFYAIKKALVKPIPFNAYSNDDVLIPMNVIRQKKRVLFEKEAISYEDLAGNVKDEFQRRIRIGAGNFQSFFWLFDFLNPFMGWPAFCYISHKVLRWFSPLFFAGIYITSALLTFIFPDIVYQIIFGGACAGILISLTYKFPGIKTLRPFYYFLVMNIALFLGLFRYASGIKSAAWSRTERE